ncbi:Predicted house-cleaning noncanonical NTP pyrophosphatase, all-alpha NTP-PPase (MazG) superfamily [Clostridium amylolyticum]|uniref:Predicted house-cleaning noncanonical NTP pyrophosphatase, all-alpha NTP-PPase (MazG) superfamily n=1 Tax=Clostridium amylolyticum TaxID=1121298 RepID=A0A1M6LSJ7_9CLOT|nr:nucleoside triphosphate pyrophosphohydrolase [Clostridium amylolyticum]SHJ74056.1 Predicted house-cleaning noncanonical NTP pyrophosphatase, all-alpha NTP-PPase (MazG) superfamily [Clostridium amylolyticum]
MKSYNKLVRDKIPEIIKEAGKTCNIRYADEKEQLKLLEEKLQEEVSEYIEAKNLEELADIMEVLFGLAKNLGFCEEDLLKCREDKRSKRGGFEEGVVLLEVYE